MKKLKRSNYFIYNKRNYFAVMIISSLSELLAIGLTMCYGNLVSVVSNSKLFTDVLPMIIFTIVCTFSYIFIYWLSEYLEKLYAAKNLYVLRNVYTKKLFYTKYSIVTKDNSSRYINNLTNDIVNLVNTYTLNYVYLVACIVSIISSFIAVVILNWQIALSMVGFSALMGILPLIIKKPLDVSIVNKSKATRDYMQSLKDNILGISIIKNNNAEDLTASTIENYNNKLFLASKKNVKINSVASSLGNMVKNFAILFLIILTCYFVFIGKVQIGAVLSVFSIGTAFYGSILECAWIITQLTSMQGTKEIVDEVLKFPEVNNGSPIIFKDRIRFNNVTFQYPSEERVVLKNISLVFDKNKKYLVIGKSGSGKSSILKLLCKFYDNYTGEIYIDDTSYVNLTENQINKIVAYSQQIGYIFNTTLKDNISFSNHVDINKIEDVIKIVNLGNFISLLPNGIETIIDEEVHQVSGGEKLRINLARSLYKNSEILLLDEVTSALDKKTSEIVEKNLLMLSQKTIINICHKFNDDTLSLYDLIYIIEDGEVVLSGKYMDIKDNTIFKKYLHANANN